MLDSLRILSLPEQQCRRIIIIPGCPPLWSFGARPLCAWSIMIGESKFSTPSTSERGSSMKQLRFATLMPSVTLTICKKFVIEVCAFFLQYLAFLCQFLFFFPKLLSYQMNHWVIFPFLFYVNRFNVSFV